MIEHLPSRHAALGLIPNTVVIKGRLNNQRIYFTYIHISIFTLKSLKSLVIQKIEIKVLMRYDIILAKQSIPSPIIPSVARTERIKNSHTLMPKY